MLILRFTPRGILRPRLDTTRSCRISASSALWNSFHRGGGESRQLRQFATGHAHRMGEGEPVRVLACRQLAFVSTMNWDLGGPDVGRQSELWIFDLPSGRLTQVTHDTLMQCTPRWMG